MNMSNSFQIMFMKAVKEQDVELAESTYVDCTQHAIDAKDKLEMMLKHEFLNMKKSLTTTQQFIQFAIKLAKKNLIGTHIPAILINVLFTIMPLDKCQDYFALVEKNIDTWKADEFFDKTKHVLLRLCNNLLSRFSTVEHAIIRGKILIFLSILLPFDDRSGCNIDNQFNTEYLLVESETLLDINNEISVDVNFDNFKLLQKYLREPDKCVTKEHWDTFLQCTICVLNYFLHNEVKEEHSSSDVSQIRGKINYTNSFLRASVLNGTFRRQILVQILIVYQYLNSIVLSMEQLEAIKKNTETVYQILRSSPPDGEQFVTRINKLLESEKRWSAWKSAGCPELRKPTSMKINFANLPEKRQLGDILKEKLTGKKTASPHTTTTLEDCKSKERNFLPKLTSYLREAAEELTPDSTIAERNKKIYNGDFGWKAIRLMAKRSNRFFDYQKEPMGNRAEYLKTMILKVLDAELESAEVTDDELSEEACASTIQVQITSSEFEGLFGTLGDDWKLVAMKLGFTKDEIDSIDVSNPTPLKRASCILRSWFEGPNNPTIEHFCSIMDIVGHAEISQIIQMNYLAGDTNKAIEKNEEAIEETLALLDVQDTTNTPESVIVISDDEEECSDKVTKLSVKFD